MKLVYIWIKEYGCLKDVEFNFSSYNFSFNHEQGYLNCSKKDMEINNLLFNKEREAYVDELKTNKKIFKTIDNLTAIVGNNGAGKSTVLDIICKIFSEPLTSIQITAIYCFEENNKIYIYNSFKGELEKEIEINYIEDIEIFNFKISEENRDIFYIKDNNKIIVPENKKLANYYNQELKKKTKVIYFSNEFNALSIERLYDPIVDISTSGLLDKDKSNDFENRKVPFGYNPIYCFKEHDLFRQVDYICSYNDNDKYLDFDLPHNIEVTFKEINYVWKSIYSTVNVKYAEVDSIIDIEKMIKLEENKDEISDEDKLLANIVKVKEHLKGANSNILDSTCLKFNISLLKGIFTEFLYEHLVISLPKNNTDEDIYKLVSDEICNSFLKKEINWVDSNSIYDSFISFFQNVQNGKEKNLSYKLKGKNEKFIESIKKFKNEINKEFIIDVKYLYLYKNFQLNLDSDEKISSLRYFYNIYINTAKWVDYLSFSWGVSSGEYNMIALYARLFSLINPSLDKRKDFEGINDVILLIDEADLAYHPQWQQKYIKDLISFLNENYYEYSVQIIVTTHSPILLSDIPDENVIFLKKTNGITNVVDKKMKTFGANIYNLYRDAFFLSKNNYGIVGTFATEKINEVNVILSKWFDKVNLINMKIENYKDEEFRDGYIKEDIYIKKLKQEFINCYSEKAKSDLGKCKKIIDMIGEQVIKDILLRKYNILFEIFNNDKKVEENKELRRIKEEFKGLSKSDQNELIKYIIESRKSDV